MITYLEDLPSLAMSSLKRAGFFVLGHASMRVGEAEVDVLLAGDHSAIAATVTFGEIVVRQNFDVRYAPLRYGVRPFFICPATQRPVAALYLLDGKLVSRISAKAKHKSASHSKSIVAEGRTQNLVRRIRGSGGKGAARGNRRLALAKELAPLADQIPDRRVARLVMMTLRRYDPHSHLHRPRRLDPRASTRIGLRNGGYPLIGQDLKVVKDQILAQLGNYMHAVWNPKRPKVKIPALIYRVPRLDIRALQTHGLLRPGEIRYATLHWGRELAGPTRSIQIAVNMKDPESYLFIRIYNEDTHDWHHQVAFISTVDGRYYFRCPIYAERHTTLYLRSGLFGCAKAMKLVRALPDAAFSE